MRCPPTCSVSREKDLKSYKICKLWRHNFQETVILLYKLLETLIERIEYNYKKTKLQVVINVFVTFTNYFLVFFP